MASKEFLPLINANETIQKLDRECEAEQAHITGKTARRDALGEQISALRREANNIDKEIVEHHKILQELEETRCQWVEARNMLTTIDRSPNTSTEQQFGGEKPHKHDNKMRAHDPYHQRSRVTDILDPEWHALAKAR